MPQETLLAFLLGVGAFIFIVFFFWAIPVRLWITARFAGVRARPFRDLLAMRLRRVPPASIVNAKITASKAGIPVDFDKLEAHYLAGGRIERLVNALISADKAGINLSFERAAAIDLAGRDVLEAVQISVKPKVIKTPPIAAVAKNGVQVMATAQVTVRADIERLVGGAGEDTIVARVGEGIVTTIGSAESHEAVLENPDSISRVVLDKGLDAGTAFEIVSIDIADVDVGKNVGAMLRTEQAQADMKIAQAKAEARRAMAKAEAQEMKAYTREMEAKVIEAETKIPLAMAESFNSGNLKVMDYYQLRNVMADTEMRKAIAESSAPEGSSSKGSDFSTI
ncbi:flotillin-like protein FloA [Candidatus Poribacteria bacterium]|nr:flotillin-like protein FloA [Candidatus Poribacteria bacterium]